MKTSHNVIRNRYKALPCPALLSLPAPPLSAKPTQPHAYPTLMHTPTLPYPTPATAHHPTPTHPTHLHPIKPNQTPPPHPATHPTPPLPYATPPCPTKLQRSTHLILPSPYDSDILRCGTAWQGRVGKLDGVGSGRVGTCWVKLKSLVK